MSRTDEQVSGPGMNDERDRGMTRRRLLRSVAAGAGAGLAGGITATAAQTPVTSATPAAATPLPSPAAEVDVTLLSTEAPTGSPGLVPPMPSPEEQATSPRVQAYAETLQTWFDLNPGVNIELVTLDSTNPEALLTAIAGGTAPSWYLGWGLGGTSVGELNAAFLQDLIADITPLVERYNVDASITDVARQLWAPFRANGRAYSLPGDFIFAGTGMFYRRDLIQQAGLQEPQPGWTWADVRPLAKSLTSGDVKGIGLENWAIGLALNAEAFDLETKLPAPDEPWNWRWDYTSQAEKWAAIVQDYRDMMFVDESVYADITVDMPQISEAFANGSIAMGPMNSGFMNIAGEGIPSMPARYGKPMDDLVGFVALPQGGTGCFGASQPFISNILYNPDLDETALDKAVGLYHFLWYGAGFEQRHRRIWELSQDPAQVWAAYSPVNGVTRIEGIPATPRDVWPNRFLDAVEGMMTIPVLPSEGQFIPAESSTGPSGTAWGDTQSRWTFERGDLDLRADLQQLQDARNAEAAGFESSVPDDQFVAGARAYYEALNAFWEANAPEYHQASFAPWYEENVAPILG